MNPQKYTITNKNLQRRVKSFDLSDIVDSTNFNGEYLEFYLNTPHNFISGETINVNFKNINLSNNSIIYLRPTIMVGATLAGENQEIIYLWCYERDTTIWYEVRDDGVLENYLDSIDEYEDEYEYDVNTGEGKWKENEEKVSFRTFKIIIDGMNIKEIHSDKWVNLTSNNIKLECGTYSGLSIAYTCVVPDTYFRIPYINLRNNINIIKKWWDDKKEIFYIRTDYYYNYNEKIWVDKLSEDDIDGRIICMETSNKQYYIPQENNLINLSNNKWGDFIPLDELFQQEGEIRIPYRNVSNAYYDIPILKIEPCYDNEIVYSIVLENGYDNQKFSGVQRIEINCRGAGYIVAPNIEIDLPNNPTGKQAEAYVTIKDGMIMDIVISDNGHGYTTTPTIVFSGGGGSGAMATAILYKNEFDNIENMFLLYDMKYLTFYKFISGFSINFNLEQDYTPDIMQSELVSTKFIEVETKKAINPILDNERIRFEPVYRHAVLDPRTQNLDYYVYYPINRLIYEFYFLDPVSGNHSNTPTKLYELGFIDGDVQYKKKGLSKTFCRQSFFNDRNPTIQKLEYFSSIYVNMDKLYANYVMSVNSISGNDPNNSLITTDEIAAEFYVFNPLLEKYDIVYNKNSSTNRTSIEYIQTSSSEGYYIYLFGEEYKGLTPLEIYMKMEFNNAKTGKRTLFFNRKHDKPVALNNIFFDTKDNRQHMYTDVVVSGLKVKWNIVEKRYEENLDDFELKYVWFPQKYSGENNIVWEDVKNERDKLIIKFYEADVE